MATELELMQNYERRHAQKLRGYCEFCAHRWRPRNPSVSANRCPSCAKRGGVSFASYDNTEQIDVEASRAEST